jgi:HNH endonuclease
MSLREGTDYTSAGSGCWLWMRGKTSAGYGVLYQNGKPSYAHVVSYETWYGKTPDGLELDHKCKNTNCINPEHLEPVTHAENIRRAKSTLTAIKVREIRARASYGEPLTIIASDYGMDASSIGKIVKRKRWADVS